MTTVVLESRGSSTISRTFCLGQSIEYRKQQEKEEIYEEEYVEKMCLVTTVALSFSILAGCNASPKQVEAKAIKTNLNSRANADRS